MPCHHRCPRRVPPAKQTCPPVGQSPLGKAVLGDKRHGEPPRAHDAAVCWRMSAASWKSWRTAHGSSAVASVCSRSGEGAHRSPSAARAQAPAVLLSRLPADNAVLLSRLSGRRVPGSANKPTRSRTGARGSRHANRFVACGDIPLCVQLRSWRPRLSRAAPHRRHAAVAAGRDLRQVDPPGSAGGSGDDGVRPLHEGHTIRRVVRIALPEISYHPVAVVRVVGSPCPRE